MNASMNTKRSGAHESALSAYLRNEYAVLESALKQETGVSSFIIVGDETECVMLEDTHQVTAIMAHTRKVVRRLLSKNNIKELEHVCAKGVLGITIGGRGADQSAQQKRTKKQVSYIVPLIEEYQKTHNTRILRILENFAFLTIEIYAEAVKTRNERYLKELGLVVLSEEYGLVLIPLWSKCVISEELRKSQDNRGYIPPYVLKLYDLLYSPVVRAPRAPELNSDSAHVRRLSEYLRVA